MIIWSATPVFGLGQMSHFDTKITSQATVVLLIGWTAHAPEKLDQFFPVPCLFSGGYKYSSSSQMCCTTIITIYDSYLDILRWTVFAWYVFGGPGKYRTSVSVAVWMSRAWRWPQTRPVWTQAFSLMVLKSRVFWRLSQLAAFYSMF